MNNVLIEVREDLSEEANLKRLFNEVESTISKTFNEIHSYNKRFENYSNKLGDPIECSVLIPLIFNRSNELEVLLTVRNERVALYEGEVALPGGKCDSEDKDVVATALRESREEIGLMPQNIDVLMTHPPLPLRRNGKIYLVYPVVGLVKKSFVTSLNEFEVDCVFTAGMRNFLERPKLKNEGKTFSIAIDKSNRRYCVNDFTYFILAVLACLVYREPPPEEWFKHPHLFPEYRQSLFRTVQNMACKL